MELKSNNRIHNLLSDILKISGQYNNNEIEKTKGYISRTSKGKHCDIMLSILDNFHKLSNINIDNSMKNQEIYRNNTGDNSKNIFPSKNDPNIKELMAMIQDTEFINSKKDIVKIINSYFKDRIVFRSDNKESRRDLIVKLKNEYKKMNDNQQQNIYSSIRRLYLKNRTSSLSGWADIISDGEN